MSLFDLWPHLAVALMEEGCHTVSHGDPVYRNSGPHAAAHIFVSIVLHRSGEFGLPEAVVGLHFHVRMLPRLRPQLVRLQLLSVTGVYASELQELLVTAADDEVSWPECVEPETFDLVSSASSWLRIEAAMMCSLL